MSFGLAVLSLKTALCDFDIRYKLKTKKKTPGIIRIEKDINSTKTVE